MRPPVLRGIAFRLIALITIGAIALQGLGAAVAALKGPAHYHVAPYGSAAPAPHDHAHLHMHDSGHGAVERHYHFPGAGAVVVAGAAGDTSTPAKTESPGAAFVAVLGTVPAMDTPILVHALSPASPASPRSCVLRRIERPPARA